MSDSHRSVALNLLFQRITSVICRDASSFMNRFWHKNPAPRLYSLEKQKRDFWQISKVNPNIEQVKTGKCRALSAFSKGEVFYTRRALIWNQAAAL